MAGQRLPRPLYRVRQFWLALQARPSAQDLSLAQTVLSPQQFALLCQMQPSEQAHSLNLLRQIQAQGESPHDLQVAALLHDAGKVRLPLRLWERVWVVIASTLAPAQVQHWGSQPILAGKPLPFWQRSLAVACQHSEWGARLAEEAGVSPLAAALIRRHQQKIHSANSSLEDILLLRLQAVDDEN